MNVRSPKMQGVPAVPRRAGDPATQCKITLLLEVLDADIRHLETTLSRLDMLRSLLIKRDDAALETLLREIRQQTETHEANEQKRQRLRQELAVVLGWKESELTLSRLQNEMPELQSVLGPRQTRLQSLTAQLTREHTLTALLLRDCARFNRSLWHAFFGAGGRGNVTYRPNGAPRHQTDVTLMSMQF